MLDLLPVDKTTVAKFFDEAVAAAFRDENTRRQEGRDPTQLSMSGLGGCTRANAYSIAGTPPSDQPPAEEARAALLGVGAHDWLLPALARAITAATGAVCDVEKRVALQAGGLTIPGSLDLAFDDIVVDLKTVGEHKLHGVRRREAAYPEHFIQVFGYALARRQAGQPVNWVVFLYLDRTTGEVHPIVEPFTNEALLTVVDRATTIRRLAVDPDSAPRDGRGPGVSLACDHCPWLRRCWGPNAQPAQPGPQVVAAGTWEGLQHALELYATAAAAASTADADKKFAKMVLAATRDGTYGGWKLSHGRDGDTDDVEAMKHLLTAAGIAIPRKPRAGAISIKAVKR